MTGFSSTIEFPDPARQPTSALHAVGLPIGAPTSDSPYAATGFFTPHVMARNLLGGPQTVTITVEYPKSATWNSTNGPGGPASPQVRFTGHIKKGEKNPNEAMDHPPNPDPASLTGQITLGPFTVGPYSTADLSLDAAMNQLPAPVAFCSLRIQYSGAPGSMIAQAASVDAKQDLVVDGRTMNEGDGWAGSGANPWHLDDNTESILFLTNASDKLARIGFSVTANGVHYVLTSLKLNPHETRAIDIRKLRDAQKADLRGNRIPPSAADGSVMWTRLNNVPVAGRLVVLRKDRGLSSSYDCSPCPCPASYQGCDIDPLPPSCLGPHAAMQATCIAEYKDCNGVDTFFDVTDLATWSTDNGSVATFDINYNGLLLAHAAGSAYMKASYADDEWFYSQIGGCANNLKNSSYSCPISVTDSGCPDHLEVVSDGYHLVSCAVGQMVERDTTYAVVDGNNNYVAQAVPVGEAFCCMSSNSCNNGSPTAQSCTPTSVAGEFTDHLYVGCNSVGGSCGFTITAQWHWCPTGAAQVAIGTFSNDGLYFNSTTVLGYTVPPDSGAMPTGLQVYP